MYEQPQSQSHTLIIGGGPAGLSAAHTLLSHRAGWSATVFEAGDRVGGIARTETHRGYRFDIGGHRFFTKVDRVRKFWRELLREEFLTRPRLSRIYYDGRYYDYPLKLVNAFGNLGPVEAARIMASYAKSRLRPYPVEENLEQWVSNRFGERLYEMFFKTYTEKVWGMPCTDIRADWAAQRIKNLSVAKAVWNAVTGANDTVSLIEEFQYPRLGPGQMWETCEAEISRLGGDVRRNTRVETVHREGQKVVAATVASKDGRRETISAEAFLNSMDLRTLMKSFDPAPPGAVMDAAMKLKYRDFLIVTLILNDADPFPDNWIYVHSPEVRVGRIQNFRAWSPDMTPDAATSSIGMEYFCQAEDELWRMDDADLISMAAKELEKIGLGQANKVFDGKVIRQHKAYPVYDQDYQEAVAIVLDWIDSLENFQTMGRNGLHRYNNQDHSILTAMFAAENILGAAHDLRSVNVDRAYHEEFVVDKAKPPQKAVA